MDTQGIPNRSPFLYVYVNEHMLDAWILGSLNSERTEPGKMTRAFHASPSLMEVYQKSSSNCFSNAIIMV